MSIQLAQDIIDLINARDTVKVIATVDASGAPHAVFKQSLHVGEDGRLSVTRGDRTLVDQQGEWR